MTNPAQDINVSEILAELDPLGRALFDGALERVRVRKLTARIDELERQRAGVAEPEGT